MRIRKKKWARPELAACPFYVHEPKTAAGTWGERFKKQQPIHLANARFWQSLRTEKKT